MKKNLLCNLGRTYGFAPPAVFGNLRHYSTIFLFVNTFFAFFQNIFYFFLPLPPSRGLSLERGGLHSGEVCFLSAKVALCAVTVGKQRLAEGQKVALLVISVGIGAVLHGAGQGLVPVVDLYGYHSTELRG